MEVPYWFLIVQSHNSLKVNGFAAKDTLNFDALLLWDSSFHRKILIYVKPNLDSHFMVKLHSYCDLFKVIYSFVYATLCIRFKSWNKKIGFAWDDLTFRIKWPLLTPSHYVFIIRYKLPTCISWFNPILL